MATEQWHHWGRYILLTVAIIFACGGYSIVVKGNSDNIKVLEGDVKIIQKDVHNLQLMDKDIANLAQKSVNYMTSIDQTLKSMQAIQTTQSILLDRNTIKLETLTKSD